MTHALKPNPDSLPYAGGYSLHLYCKWLNPEIALHDYEIGASEFYGQTFGECVKQARALGWVIHHDRTATCPRCKA